MALTTVAALIYLLTRNESGVPVHTMQTDSFDGESVTSGKLSPVVNPQGDDFVPPVEVEMAEIGQDLEKGKKKSFTGQNARIDLGPASSIKMYQRQPSLKDCLSNDASGKNNRR